MSDSGTRGGRVLPSMDVVRELTDQTVLDVLFDQGPTSRIDIYRLTGISKPTVNESVRRLESIGLLRPTGEAVSGRPGRAAPVFGISPDAGHVVGAAVGPTHVTVAVSDLMRSEHGARTTQITGHSVKDRRRALERALVEQVQAASTPLVRAGSPLLGITVAIAGAVDPTTGQMPELTDAIFPECVIDSRRLLSSLSTAEVTVENDVNLAALTEASDGAGQDLSSFAYLFIGAGLGVGLMLDGRLWRGARGLAGEIGYLSVTGGANRQDATRDLIQAGFGLPADDDHTQRRLDVPAMLDMLTRAADGDGKAVRQGQQMAAVIGNICSALAVIADPQAVILGGPVGAHPELRRAVQAHLAQHASLPVNLRTAHHGEDAAIRGAMWSAVGAARRSIWRRAHA